MGGGLCYPLQWVEGKKGRWLAQRRREHPQRKQRHGGGSGSRLAGFLLVGKGLNLVRSSEAPEEQSRTSALRLSTGSPMYPSPLGTLILQTQLCPPGTWASTPAVPLLSRGSLDASWLCFLTPRSCDTDRCLGALVWALEVLVARAHALQVPSQLGSGVWQADPIPERAGSPWLDVSRGAQTMHRKQFPRVHMVYQSQDGKCKISSNCSNSRLLHPPSMPFLRMTFSLLPSALNVIV